MSSYIIFIILAAAAASSSATAEGEPNVDDFVKIHAIQGDGLSSPLQDTRVSIEAIVTGDFQGTDKLKGFFVQEEDSDTDRIAKTSEGIFVYDPRRLAEKGRISRGDLVVASGYIREFNGLTQIDLKEIKKADPDKERGMVTAQEIDLPFEYEEFSGDEGLLDDAGFLERYEGMLLKLPQEFAITDIENFSKYGELTLSPLARLPAPTNVTEPGGPAALIQDLNNRSRIIIDDGSSQRYPESYSFPKTIRCGDKVQGIDGVLSYSYGNYKLQPLKSPQITTSNPRPEIPESVGGRIRVASLNLENYFNGDGTGGGFPAPRGARSKEEFELQRSKIIQAIRDMQADVIALMEVESDGYGDSSAISDLLDGLNANDASSRHYSFVNPGLSRLGDDIISVGLIYDPARLKPIGGAATIAKGAYSSGRQPLAQTFEEIGSNERFTVVAIHLKSKNPPREGEKAYGENKDMGDGQGYWNGDRKKEANELILWLSTDPTASLDSDYLMLGDVNSYRNEDPIRAFEGAGYVDLIASRLTIDSYSYEYQGSWGVLDHILASSSLAGQITGATIWHINADESPEFGYNGLWSAPDKYRCSDHDPLIAGISLS